MDHTHSHAYEEDWDELEVLLSSIVGVYASPPENAVTGSFTKGAILGNGDVGVAVGGDYNTVSFYIGKNDFWTDDAPLNTDEHRFRGVRPITLGGIDIRIGRVGMAPYRMEQDILNAEVRATLSVDKSAVYLRSWTSATENLLVTDIRSEGEESLPVTIDPAPSSRSVPGNASAFCLPSMVEKGYRTPPLPRSRSCGTMNTLRISVSCEIKHIPL